MQIRLNGKVVPYDKVIKFNCIELLLGFTNPEWQGTYGTGFTVSPLEYRRNHPTDAGVTIKHGNKRTKFTITSDYGSSSTVELPTKQYAAEIAAAIAVVKAERLLHVPRAVAVFFGTKRYGLRGLRF